MKKSKKLLAVLMALALFAGCATVLGGMDAQAAGPSTASPHEGGGDTSVTAPVSPDAGRIDTITLTSGATAYVYVPDNDFIGWRAAASPMLLVFGDQPFSADTALQTAYDSGLSIIADGELGVVMFINPIGDAWGAEDAASLPAVYDAYVSSTNSSYTDGMTAEGKYPGARTKIYTFGEGAGADFIDTYLVKGVEGPGQNDPAPVSIKPAAAYLMNPTAPVVTSNDGVQVPAYIVNGSQDIIDAFAAINEERNLMTSSSSVTSGFDKDNLLAAYDEFIEHRGSRYNQDVTIIPDWTAQGISQTLECFTAESGNEIYYFRYTTDEVENGDAGTIPLMFMFHGNDSTPEGAGFEYPGIGAIEGFMTVAVIRHYDYPLSEIIELLEHLLDTHPALDSSRVYAGGTSRGSMMAMNMMFYYPQYFAGIIPSNGASVDISGVPQYGDMSYLVMPCFYVAGATSPLSELPHQDSLFGIPVEVRTANDNDRTLEYILARNDVMDTYDFDESVDYYWGIPSDYTYSAQSNEFDNLSITVNQYKSKDGQIYTAFSTITSGHEPTRVAAEEGWKFISRFSRNADGTVSIDGEGSYGPKMLKIAVDGEAISYDYDLGQPYLNSDGRAMVPVRATAYALGMTADDIAWDGQADTVTFQLDGTQVVFTVGSKTAHSGGEAIKMDTAAVNIDGSVYVPVRYLAEAFGYQVSWDNSVRTALITK